MKPAPLTVVKVGGALLTGPADLDRVVGAIADRRAQGERLLVIVSALKGVTDRLERAAVEALDPRAGGELVRSAVEGLERVHARFVSRQPARDAMQLGVRTVLDALERLLTGIRLTGELTDRTRALVLAHGERLAAPLVAEALRAGGVDGRAVNAEEAGLRAVGPHLVGRCDLERSRPGLSALQHELHDRVLVLTGFYGIDDDGDVVLFGRGGTDYTAGIAAAGTDADGFELWKDVPGFMTADPGLVPEARLVPELSFDEACELGYYGARILHPRCLEPLRGRPVSVSLRFIGDTTRAGTQVVERRTPSEERPAAVAALAHREGQAVVRVEGAAMVNQPGVAGGVLGALGDAGINVEAVASSMTSLSFTVDEDQAALARSTLRVLAERGLAGVERVELHTGVALLGVVGDRVARGPAIAARMLDCLARHGVPIELISHGPRDVGLSCAVPGHQLEAALTALHRVFFAVPRPAVP